MGFKAITVLIPVVTETKSLIETIETIVNICSKDDLQEIIICPAYFASSECKNITKVLCDKYRDVPVNIFMQTGSFDQALKDMFNIVSGSHFMIQPADLEEDPNMLTVFINESKKHPDAIITGSRFVSKGCSDNYSRIRKIFIYFFRGLFRIVYSKKLTDTTFSYRTIPTEKVKNLILSGKSYSVLYEAFLKMIRSGTEVIEVPVMFHKRLDGKSRTNFFKDGIRYLWVFFRVRFADTDKFYASNAEH